MKILNRSIAMMLAFLPMAVAGQAPTASPLSPGPTTKILAIGKLAGRPTPDQMKLLATQEVPATVRLYLAGKIDQWYSLQEGNGVVFVVNATSVEEARTMLEQLPLGQAKLMTFELTPLGPLKPLGLLLTQPDKKAQ